MPLRVQQELLSSSRYLFFYGGMADEMRALSLLFPAIDLLGVYSLYPVRATLRVIRKKINRGQKRPAGSQVQSGFENRLGDGHRLLFIPKRFL